jgi:hypothetical protein
MIANVGSKWSDGKLIFFNKADGATILTIDSDGDVELGTAQFMSGQRFQVTFPNIAAADVAKAFFVAPAACKLISAYEIHGTVCDAADTLQIEKCTSGEDAGAGDELLAAVFTLNSTANTPVTKAAVTTAAATLAAGDALLLKFKTGDGTNYAEGCVTCTMEWL